MGKYSHVLPGLEKKPVDDQKYQEKVNQRKAEIVRELAEIGEAASAVLFARKYQTARVTRDGIKAQASEAELELEAVSQLLIDQYEEDGTSSVKLADGSTVATQPEPSGVVLDPEVFRLWCIANGLERSLRLAPQSLSALVRERLLNGEPEPDGTKAFVRTKLVYTKSKEVM